MLRFPGLAIVIFLATACSTGDVPDTIVDGDAYANAPSWAREVVWYQIFPERFRNGDHSNDPVRESIEFWDLAPESWRVSNWTGDWYAQDDWEREVSDFYNPAVFLRRYGGDLEGVRQALPYLDSLGVTGIYFNPVFYGRSLHKYDASSFHHIDPYFGPDPAGDILLMQQETGDPSSWHWTAADKLFLEVLREARERGIRVIIDGVFNHSGRDFFAFENLSRLQEQSPYKDWYVVKEFDNPETEENEFDYQGWWDVDTLPVFSEPDGTDLHPEIKQYIFDITSRWMDPNGDGNPDDGIDGWRLDVTEEVPIQFWKDWNAHVRQLNPEAYTATEIWAEAHEWVQSGGFSATMNYNGFAIPVHDFFVDKRISASAFVDRITASREAYYPAVASVLQNLTDSHDTDRLASMLVNPDDAEYDRDNSPRYGETYEVRAPVEAEKETLRLIALVQMTYVGAPMLYYGTEAGMWGADDPDDRKPMLWPDLQYDDEKTDPRGQSRNPDPVRFDSDLFSYYQQVIALRSHYSDALVDGTIVFENVEDASEVIVYSRRGEYARTLWVVLNPSEEARKISIPAAENVRAIFVSSGQLESIEIEETDGQRFLHLPPRTGIVLANPTD